MMWAALVAQAEVAPDADPGEAEVPRAADLPPVDNLLPPPPPPFFTEATVRLSYRLGPASDNAGPPVGVGFGFTLGGRYALIGNRVELAAAADFAYAHHRKGVEGVRTLPSGQLETFDGEQVISENTFGAMQLASLLFAGVTPWVAVGGGLAVGFFESDAPRLRPGTQRAYRPYGQLAAGARFPLAEGPFYIDARVDYHLMLSEPALGTEAGERPQVLGDLVAVGAAFGSRF